MQERARVRGRPPGKTSFEEGPAKAFGQAVRELRLKRGLSQEELGAAARVERSHMGKIERGEHLPSLAVVLRLAESLSCRPGKLVDRMAELLRPRDATK
ncbi:MAG TPA: helix-turn-helix transcriptional regulator [Methylibium sp.]|uniref:helix-turn-helix domain-containing protein n=1 Tax=Methylibium sp. TaxID=2067992 RepID=UPI002DB864DF|nr:helix-turn-helix transcriptional regulator [Methylibium sp.]HEU4459742.1 helix-turn-helix transcriptional regulator [Methylibium sp.]